MAKGQELVPVKDYSVMSLPEGELQEIVRGNIGPGGLSQFDLDRLKVPAGGGIQWAVPTLEGEPEMQKEVTGVCIYWKDVRAYWRIGYDESGGGSPPDCSSEDSFTGAGKRWEEDELGEHDCGKCPLAQFGSALDKKGEPGARGQACKAMRILFLMTPQLVLPQVVACPPTSLQTVRQFMLRLASAVIPYQGVVMGLTLQEDKNADGIKYSKIVPTMKERLSAEETERFKALGNTFAPMLDATAQRVAQDQGSYQES